jgi:Rnl2 family RNA ligase
MDFLAYHKINKVNESLLDLYKKIDKWCVCEKVHGANFAFQWFQETNSIKYAKRNSFIEENDDFFGYKEILPHTLPNIELIIKIINEKYNNNTLSQIIVFGELFGGIYPNMKTKAKAVQKGVFYSPHLHFYAFDIYIKEKNKNGYFLDYEDSSSIFEKVNILYAKPLQIYENIQDAIKHPIYYDSTIPQALGLCKLENNKAEGIVIRNMGKIDKNIFSETEYKKIKQKVMIKLKIPEFMETQIECKVKNSIKKDINNNDNDNDNDTLEIWKNEAKKYMNKNRLQNAISKIGTLNKFTHNEIFKLYIQDILEEMNAIDNIELKNWLYKIHKIKG